MGLVHELAKAEVVLDALSVIEITFVKQQLVRSEHILIKARLLIVAVCS